MGAWVGSASEACGSHPGARITTEGFVRVTPNLAQPLLQAGGFRKGFRVVEGLGFGV